MSPCFAGGYRSDARMAYPVLSGYSSWADARGVQKPYFYHLIFIQLRETVVFSLRSSAVALTAFGNHVGNIFCLRAQKQMVRVAAKRVVTLVANVHVGFYWTYKYLPSNAMGSPRSCPDANLAVTVSGFAPAPNPATARGNFHAVLDPLLYWNDDSVTLSEAQPFSSFPPFGNVAIRGRPSRQSAAAFANSHFGTIPPLISWGGV